MSKGKKIRKNTKVQEKLKKFGELFPALDISVRIDEEDQADGAESVKPSKVGNDVECQEEPSTFDKSKPPLIDPTWRHQDLPDLAKRMLALEVANPGILTSDMIKLMKYEGDSKKVYEYRKLPMYQALLHETRKDEWELARELHVEALKVLRRHLRSGNPMHSLKAADILSRANLRMQAKKAELEIMREASAAAIRTPVRHIVEFKTAQPLPIMGRTVMTPDGRIVGRDSEEGRRVIEAEATIVEQPKLEQRAQGLPDKPVDLTLKRPEPKSKEGEDDRDDDGVIGGVL